MKKFLFYIFFLLSLGFLIDVIGKIVVDFERLNQFGWGFIAGRIVLVVIFIVITWVLFSKTYGKQEAE